MIDVMYILLLEQKAQKKRKEKVPIQPLYILHNNIYTHIYIVHFMSIKFKINRYTCTKTERNHSFNPRN